MAWPKLRNKSSRSVTVGNRSGAAYNGARSQGGTAEGTAGGQAQTPDMPAGSRRGTRTGGGTWTGAVRGTGGAYGRGGTGGPAAWRGTDTQRRSGAAGVRQAERGGAGQRADGAPADGPPGGPAPAQRG